MATSTQATVTKLLTLLNVSAAKSTSKRRRTDLTTSAKLGGSQHQPKQQPASTPAANQDDESAADLEQDAPEGADEPELPAVHDPYVLHFGQDSAHLTTSAREAVAAGKWNNKRRKIDHVGRVFDQLPAGQSTVQPASILPKLLETYPSDASRNLSKAVLNAISNYQDLYLSKAPIGASEDARSSIALHAVNHVSKKRRAILKTNERITAASKNEAVQQPSIGDKQDQGFTRPSVLILLPLRNSALRWVNLLLAALPGHQVDNQGRFESEFSLPSNATDKLASAPPGTYPRDHVSTFKGNIDDTFRVGIKLTRKNVKLFSDFYSSDIIIASPLGLRLSIGKEKTGDFLSSIEILVIDQTDVLTMQNWEHVQFVFSSLNELPQKGDHSDWERVKTWYLEKHAKYLRQSILLSAYETPEIRSLFNSSFNNVAGKLRTEHSWQAIKVPEGVSQNFVRFEAPNLQQEPDSRFDFFTKTVFPSIQKSAVQSVKTMFFVPSYFDFVRLKKHFKALELSVAFLSEYSSNQDISRARQAFFSGDKGFLVMTERFHFFRRYKIRGVRNVVFYQAPDHAQFYSELLSFPFLDEGVEASDVSVRVLYSSYDCMRLERLAGTAALSGLLEA
ncbi:DUF1253-domain-containing protein [Auriculariales sp. MPI-PUGE-AT-0066]|nr:DUF1253-domain-containing protein [Auriculariales sp. MPI-PUGE-AT-0066]